MSKVCDVCGRGKMGGCNVSHSNRKSNRTFELNLQKTTVDGKPVKACAKCIKTAKSK
ncbi:MAG: 50S ribosomal protein L28 [Clostridia bacterium]